MEVELERQLHPRGSEESRTGAFILLGSLCYVDKLLSLPHLLLRAGARTEREHANEGAL